MSIVLSGVCFSGIFCISCWRWSIGIFIPGIFCICGCGAGVLFSEGICIPGISGILCCWACIGKTKAAEMSSTPANLAARTDLSAMSASHAGHILHLVRRLLLFQFQILVVLIRRKDSDERHHASHKSAPSLGKADGF